MTETIENQTVGKLEYEENSVLIFKEGMLGLPNYKRYILLQSDDIKPFYRLQCLDEESISFLLLEPAHIDPSYRDYVASVDKSGSLMEKQNALLVVINLVQETGEITANLVAPVILNHNTMEGVQTILMDSPYSVKHNLMQEAERKEA